MTTFKDIVLKDGQPTEQGIRAMEMVCKALSIEWHKWIETTFRSPTGWYKHICLCGFWYKTKGSDSPWHVGHHPVDNPALLTSLDAWRPLWDKLIEIGLDRYYSGTLLQEVATTEGGRFLWCAYPHHHLEAALMTLEDTCPDCEGCGEIEHDTGGVNPWGDPITALQPCTCNDGKRTLYELWKREVKR